MLIHSITFAIRGCNQDLGRLEPRHICRLKTQGHNTSVILVRLPIRITPRITPGITYGITGRQARGSRCLHPGQVEIGSFSITPYAETLEGLCCELCAVSLLTGASQSLVHRAQGRTLPG